VVGDKVIVGFNRDELVQALQLSYKKEKRIADRKLFETSDRVLEALIRAVRQVPPDRLMWKTQDRDRTLKVFCYHILADPNHVLDAISTQKYDGSFKLTYGEAAERFRTMEEVAQFGEETRRRIKEASQKLASEELDRPIDGYSGQTTGHELLHHVLAHTAQHLRQLYEFLRMIGVAPAEPLKEEDFEGIQMPKDLW
jgi:uncharacterized damage-inducible protein DinB